MKKNIDLPQDVIDRVSIQAIQSGKKNFKNYVEYLLTEFSKGKESEFVTLSSKDLEVEINRKGSL